MKKINLKGAAMEKKSVRELAAGLSRLGKLYSNYARVAIEDACSAPRTI